MWWPTRWPTSTTEHPASIHAWRCSQLTGKHPLVLLVSNCQINTNCFSHEEVSASLWEWGGGHPGVLGNGKGMLTYTG